jgi:hypothetical protein
MVNLLLTKNNPIDQFNVMFDLYVWFFLQTWYMPNYVIGKQDEWKDWVGSSLNGWKSFNICKA